MKAADILIDASKRLFALLMELEAKVESQESLLTEQRQEIEQLERKQYRPGTGDWYLEPWQAGGNLISGEYYLVTCDCKPRILRVQSGCWYNTEGVVVSTPSQIIAQVKLK